MEAQINTGTWKAKEVQDICDEMENMYRKDAQKDSQRLRDLIQQRNAIRATCQQQRAETQKQLSQVLLNASDWEKQTAATKARQLQLTERLHELEVLKREMVVQLERLRADEQSSKENLDHLLEKYETTIAEISRYDQEHVHDVDRAKHLMSLFASITGIRWDFTGEQVAGEIHAQNTRCIVPFQVDTLANQFDAVNAIWDKIDQAFEDALCK